jgi:GNAT superfamily N-acetyltransferase
MNDILRDSSPAAIAAAAEANTRAHFAIFRHLPKAEMSDRPARLRFATGVPLGYFNGVIQKEIPAEEATKEMEREIDETLAFFRQRQLPFWWWFMPSVAAQSAQFAEQLVSQGMEDWGQHFLMALDLAQMHEEWPVPSGLTIERVADEESLDTYVQISGQAFTNPHWPAGITTLFGGLGLEPSVPYHHYLARLDGEPVASASMFYGGGIASVQHVATPPALRRQGIGTALTVALLRDARALGYRVAVLGATELGYGVYKRIGFEDACPVRLFTWSP